MDRFSETAFSFRRTSPELEEERAHEHDLDVDSFPCCGNCDARSEQLVWASVENLWLCPECLIGIYQNWLEALDGPPCGCFAIAADQLSTAGCPAHDPESTWPSDYRQYVANIEALRFLLIENHLWPIPSATEESRKAAA